MPGVPDPIQGLRSLDWLLASEGEWANSREIKIDESLKDLCYSIVANGLLQSVGAIDYGDYGIPIFGFRRLAAIRYGLSQGLAVPEQIPVLLFPPTTTPSQIKIINLTENIHRADLTGWEKYQACMKLIELSPNLQNKELAELLNLSPAAITHLLSPSKLSADWQEALKAGLVPIADCYKASQLDAEGMAKLLALKLSGASGEERRKAVRKSRSKVETVRMTRVDIPMAGDIRVTLRGADLGMAEVVDLLSEALKEAKKAAEVYDVKTFQNMMRDKAKVG